MELLWSLDHSLKPSGLSTIKRSKYVKLELSYKKVIKLWEIIMLLYYEKLLLFFNRLMRSNVGMQYSSQIKSWPIKPEEKNELISMIDSCWILGQSETKALNGWF